MNKENALILCTADEVYRAIENEMLRLKRNISNEEVQALLWRLVEEKKAKFIGTTTQDIDLLVGNLREDGFKIKNLKEKDGSC
jgi:hypothetical protein